RERHIAGTAWSSKRHLNIDLLPSPLEPVQGAAQPKSKVRNTLDTTPLRPDIIFGKDSNNHALRLICCIYTLKIAPRKCYRQIDLHTEGCRGRTMKYPLYLFISIALAVNSNSNSASGQTVKAAFRAPVHCDDMMLKSGARSCGTDWSLMEAELSYS